MNSWFGSIRVNYLEFEHLDQDLLVKMNDALANSIGIHFEPNRLPDLEKAVAAAALESGYDLNQIAQFGLKICQYATTPDELESVARHLTVGETYFFREAKVFSELKVLLPQLLAKNINSKTLNIWSAGCCTGEEAYSLAILVSMVIGERLELDLGRLSEWQIRVYGSDINRAYLKKAESGIYSAWSFRGQEKEEQEIKARFFDKVASGDYKVAPAVMDMVSFSYLNLADDYSYLEALKCLPLDMVLCRNVLIYFGAKIATAVLERFRQALNPQGWLLLASSDLPAPGLTGLFEKLPWASEDMPLFQKLYAPDNSSEKKQLRPAADEQKYDLKFARKLMQQGQYQNCKRIVDSALAKLSLPDKRRPDHNLYSQFLELKVKLLSNLGESAAACEQASQLVALRRTYEYLYLYAMVLNENGEKLRAEEIILQAITEKPDFAAALLMYATLLKSKGEHDMAQVQLSNLHAILMKLDASEIVECSGDTLTRELISTVQQLMGEP